MCAVAGSDIGGLFSWWRSQRERLRFGCGERGRPTAVAVHAGRDESGDSDSESEAEGQADAGAERAGQAEVQPSDEADEAVPDITEAALTTRWSEVFVIGESWPKAVGKPLLAKTVTNKLVKLAIEVVKKLLERDGKALSKSFGNFDQRVALGWLLADARGWPLLEKAHALACGTKAQREGGYIRDAIKLARKAALTAARAAGADAPAAQDEAYIARLHAYIDWQDACIDGADVEIAVQSACNAVLAE